MLLHRRHPENYRIGDIVAGVSVCFTCTVQCTMQVYYLNSRIPAQAMKTPGTKNNVAQCHSLTEDCW